MNFQNMIKLYLQLLVRGLIKLKLHTKIWNEVEQQDLESGSIIKKLYIHMGKKIKVHNTGG